MAWVYPYVQIQKAKIVEEVRTQMTRAEAHRRQEGVAIRRIEGDAEFDAAFELWLSVNLEAHSFVDAKYWRGVAGYVAEAIRGATLFGAFEGTRLVGFVGVVAERIEGLFVRADRRGEGIGSALLAKALEGARRMELSVYCQNERATAFYRRRGFVEEAQRVDSATGEREWTMRWER